MIHCFLDGRDIDVAKQLQNKNVEVHLFKSEKD
jgi:hypothetical protein